MFGKPLLVNQPQQPQNSGTSLFPNANNNMGGSLFGNMQANNNQATASQWGNQPGGS